MKRAEIVAIGSVQRVGFRYHVDGIARELGLSGHVKNLDDGTVEIICEGDQDAINTLIDKIRVLKPPVNVKDVQVAYSDPQGLTKFEVVLGDQLREMAEGFGTGATYMGMMLGKQDQTVSEIRTLSSTLREMIDSRLERLENEVREIKARLPN